MYKNDNGYVSAPAAAAVGATMSRDAPLLGTVAHPESFSLESQSSPRRKMCSLSISPSVMTDLRKDSFDRSDLLLNIEELNHSNVQNYQTDWKLKDSETVFGTSVNLLQNGMPAQKLYKRDMDRYSLTDRASDPIDVPTKAFKNRADTTRRSVNSESSNSQFDPLDNEDISLVKHEDSLEKISLEPVSCSVCGDTVAGFHCGAYVCEACKKFFVRCLKQDAGMKFTCAHNQSCEITKETRTQCPSCRFQKCLKLGMYKPGGPNVSSEIGHIPCKVCGAPSSGFHFGAITCEGCKGFFRRTVKERDSLKYQCSRNSSCIITWKTRNVCKMCRYRQCLKAGMKPDKSRIGRQPNSVKHATMLELNQIKTAKGLTPLPFPVREFKSEPLDFIECEEDVNPVILPDSNNHGIAPLSATSCENLNRCDSAELQMSNGALAELQSVTDAAQLKVENLQNDHRDRMRYDVQMYARNEANQYRPPDGLKLPVAVPTPSPTDLYAGRQPQYTTVAATHFNDFAVNPALGSESFKTVALPANDREEFYEKFPPGSIEVTCSDVPPSVPFAKPISPPDKPTSPLPDYETVISIIQHSYKDLSMILSRPDIEEITANSSMSNIWDSMMTQFAHCAQATLRFAKKVPGFRKFAISEQIHMVQSSMFPIVVVVLSLIYDEVAERFCYFMYSHNEMCYILKRFEPFQLLVPTLHHMGRKVRQLDLDEVEVAFLCALHLMDSGNKHVYKELLLDSLEEYIRKKFGQVCDRNGQILLCLRDMVTTNHIHQQAVNTMLCPGSKYSNLEIPQLFKESFIGMDDD